MVANVCSRLQIVQAGAASGLLLAAATSQIGLGLLCFVALIPLLLLIDRGARPRAAGAAGWLAGVILFGVALAWVPLAGFRGLPLLLLIPYVLAVGLSVAGVAALLSWLRGHDRRLFLAAVPLVWICAELARAQGSLGYPWHQLGYALSPWPAMIQLAAFGGIYSLSLWIVTVNTAWVGLRGVARPVQLACMAVLAAPLLLGLRALSPTPSADSLTVAAVQPAVEIPGRFESQRFRANLGTLLELTETGLGREAPDLVVWPESAFERPIHRSGDPLLGSISLHLGAPLLTGAWRLDPGPPTALYNSAVLARPDGSIDLAGDKIHPVPFYESTPEGALDHALARLDLWPGRFRPGDRPGLVPLGAAVGSQAQIGVLICLDSSYPGLTRELRRRGARLLVEISNEAQTGEWSAVQHAMVSRMRAVENGVPLVRVGNIGPTEWINARGRLLARIDAGAVGSHAASVALAGEPTFYTSGGDVPAFSAGVLPLIIFIFTRGRTRVRTTGARLAMAP
jgi:apolipoprotein N-acyltransferase